MPTPPWPASAGAQLAQARNTSAHEGELVKLILDGTLSLDSWLIAHRLLPELQARGIGGLRFTQQLPEQPPRTAQLVPLDDGSAFAQDNDGTWMALDADAARAEIEHMGFRFAPENHWFHGFGAESLAADGSATPLTPLEVAQYWEQRTGQRPAGFSTGFLDQVEALGLDVLDRTLTGRSKLGL